MSDVFLKNKKPQEFFNSWGFFLGRNQINAANYGLTVPCAGAAGATASGAAGVVPSAGGVASAGAVVSAGAVASVGAAGATASG